MDIYIEIKCYYYVPVFLHNNWLYLYTVMRFEICISVVSKVFVQFWESCLQNKHYISAGTKSFQFQHTSKNVEGEKNLSLDVLNHTVTQWEHTFSLSFSQSILPQILTHRCQLQWLLHIFPCHNIHISTHIKYTTYVSFDTQQAIFVHWGLLLLLWVSVLGVSLTAVFSPRFFLIDRKYFKQWKCQKCALSVSTAWGFYFFS